MSDVSESLISLTKNERPWAIRSGRSEEMSDVSESLISLTKNERMSESLIFLSELLIRSFFDKKRAIRSEIKWANSQPCRIYMRRHATTSRAYSRGLFAVPAVLGLIKT